MICAIHQPNFFPWLGYFDKIRKSDVFVFLDVVDYPKSGSGSGSWVNRVKLNIQGQAQWLTCPIRRLDGRWKINETRMLDDSWRDKLIKTLHFNYSKSQNYSDVMDFISPLVSIPTQSLSEFNMEVIMKVSELLGIDAKFIRQSNLNIETNSTQLLVDITKAVGASTYLCGNGANGYQEDGLFPENGLTLHYQNFEPKPYGNPNNFLPGLSVLDYLMTREKDDTW